MAVPSQLAILEEKKSCNPHTPFSFVAHNTIPGRKKEQEISPELLQKNYKQTWYFLSFIQGQCSFSVTPVSSLTQSHTPTPGGCPICHFSGGGEAGLVPQSRAQLWHEAAASAIHSRSFPNVLSGKVTRIKCWLVMSLQTRSCLDYINMSKSCSITLTWWRRGCWSSDRWESCQAIDRSSRPCFNICKFDIRKYS